MLVDSNKGNEEMKDEGGKEGVKKEEVEAKKPE